MPLSGRRAAAEGQRKRESKSARQQATETNEVFFYLESVAERVLDSTALVRVWQAFCKNNVWGLAQQHQ